MQPPHRTTQNWPYRMRSTAFAFLRSSNVARCNRTNAYSFKQTERSRLRDGRPSCCGTGHRREAQRRTAGRSARRKESGGSGARETRRGEGRRRQGGGVVASKTKSYREEGGSGTLALT